MKKKRVIWFEPGMGDRRVNVEVRTTGGIAYPTMTQGWYKDDPRMSQPEKALNVYCFSYGITIRGN